jgi:1-phosphofructokinase family hexose kinase
VILTLTINPAIDRTVTVDRLVFEDRAYILSVKEDVGGRGVNASCVIHTFGAPTAAILTAGGEAGAEIERYMKKRTFPSEIVGIQNESRTNLTISDKQGLTIKLNELGAAMSDPELKRLRAAVEKWLPKATWLMICGSIPPGVSPHFYSELIELAARKGVKTLLDADGDALLHGIEAKPTAVTPNQHEAERLLNRALITRSQFIEAAQRIHALGAKSVLLSLGSRGAMAADGDQLYEVLAPRVDALCPIGAGDALAAAFVWASNRKRPFQEAIRWAVAAGTASAVLPGMAMANLEQTREMFKRVEVRPAA